MSYLVKVLVLAILPILAAARDASWDSVTVGGQIIRRGMKKTDVLSRLAETSTLKRMPEFQGRYSGPVSSIPERWCVQPKGFVGPQWDCEIISFVEGEVAEASAKLDSTAGVETANVMRRLYTVFSQAERSHVPVQVTTLEGGANSRQLRVIRVTIGSKCFDIVIDQPDNTLGQSTTSLWEKIE